LVCGAKRYTTAEAIERFIAATTAAANGESLAATTAAANGESPAVGTPRARRLAVEAADRELREAGI
jgi:hypothetical protein